MKQRAFVKASDVREGTILIADDAFTCVKAGCELMVEQDDDGVQFFRCADGQHFLKGQRGFTVADKHGFVGFTLKEPVPQAATPRRRGAGKPSGRK